MLVGDLPGANEYRVAVDLTNGTFHDVVLEYREETGAASIQVSHPVAIVVRRTSRGC